MTKIRTSYVVDTYVDIQINSVNMHTNIFHSLISDVRDR